MAVRHTNSVFSRVEGLAFDAYMGLFGALPVERASAVGSAIMRRLGPMLRVQKVARTNLALAFPDADKARVDAILEGMWDNLGRTAAEFPHMRNLRVYDPKGRVEVVNAERIDELAAAGTGAVLISGHFANWELLAATIVQRGVTCHVSYRPTNNPHVNQRIIDVRHAYGVAHQSPKSRAGGMGLMRGLAKGELIALMADQKNNEGVAAPFFGHTAMTADIPARFARRFGCPIVPFSLKRLPDVRFQVVVHEPIMPSAVDDDDAAIFETTAEVNRFLEARVREAPEQWFWVHRRWPVDTYKRPPETAAAA